MDIVRKIDDLRVRRNWTFYKLSKETGLSQQTFTKWMEGKSTPSLDALKAVCGAFGITLANFFAENNMVELTEDTKAVFENWHYLTKEEQQSIKAIIENYVNRRK